MLADRIIFVGMLVLALVYFQATERIPELSIGDPLGPKAFPRLLAAGLIVTALILLAEMWRAGRSGAARPAGEPGKGSLPMLAAVTAWIGLYFALFEPIGYLLATAIFLLGLMAWFHRGRWLANILTTTLFTLGSYLLFVKLLSVNLAKGVFAF